MQAAVTVSLVAEAAGGPFVFWHDLPEACRLARELGFDAIELFAPGPEAVPSRELARLLADHGLRLAAVGTGAGWVRQHLTLTSPDPAVRHQAYDFVRQMIDYGAAHGAPAIIGSMQGRWTPPATRPDTEQHLLDALTRLGDHAANLQKKLIYEPLNRYETNLINRVADACEFVARTGLPNVVVLADLFHMNIEEVSIPAAIVAGGSRIGHVHLADSNRRPAGGGHTDFAPIAAALRQIEYRGVISAEAFAYPDSLQAARQTMATFRRYFAQPHPHPEG